MQNAQVASPVSPDGAGPPRRPLKYLVLHSLREEIASGRAAPGSWLSQEDVARRFSVSQTPVREAFKTLAAEGLVEYAPYRGVRVIELSPQDVAHLFGVREILETIAVREAVKRIDGRTLTQMQAVLESLLAIRDPGRALERKGLNEEFHLLTWRASGSRYLVQFLELAWNLTPFSLLYEASRVQAGAWRRWVETEDAQHKELLNALEERDEERAAAVVRAHVRNSVAELSSILGIEAKDKLDGTLLEAAHGG